MLGWSHILGLPEQEAFWEVADCPSPHMSESRVVITPRWLGKELNSLCSSSGWKKEGKPEPLLISCCRENWLCLSLQGCAAFHDGFFGSRLFLGRIHRLPLSLFSWLCQLVCRSEEKYFRICCWYKSYHEYLQWNVLAR